MAIQSRFDVTPRKAVRDTLALVLAGGAGTRLKDLTRWHSKPAVPLLRFTDSYASCQILITLDLNQIYCKQSQKHLGTIPTVSAANVCPVPAFMKKQNEDAQSPLST